MSFAEVMGWAAYVAVIGACEVSVVVLAVLGRPRWLAVPVAAVGFGAMLVVGLMAPDWAMPPGSG